MDRPRIPQRVRIALIAAGTLAAFAYVLWNADTAPSRRAAASAETPRRVILFHDGPDGLVVAGPGLGQVGDVAAAPTGAVYVLDVEWNRLSVYAPDGTPQIVGQPGRQRGEFGRPVGLALDGDGRLYVLDPGNRRLEVFALGGTAHAHSIELGWSPADLCIAGRRLFLLGSREEKLIHEASLLDGRVLRSFAPDSALRRLGMERYLANGYLHCDGEGITFLPHYRGQVERYSAATGELLGSLPIPDYRAARVRPDGNAYVDWEAPDGGRHSRGAAMVGLPDGRLLVQVGIIPLHGQDSELDSIRSYLVSWPERRIREAGESLPRIMAVRGDTGFAALKDTVPRVPLAGLLAEGGTR